MFTEYHVMQFILHCLITNIKNCTAQTALCAVSFDTEQYQSTKLFIIQSTINHPHFHPNIHHNILLP
jgi:DTW domain-containing protein YfiP